MAARKFNHLRDFRFGDFIGEHAANSDSVTMHMQHDLDSFVAAFVEESLQNVNDELHGRIIVVQDEDLVQARLLRFRARFRDDARTGPVSRSVSLALPAIPVVAHAS